MTYGRRGVFQKVFPSSLTPQDLVFTSRFYHKIKRKGGEFDRCKVRLVVKVQNMRRKGEDGVGNYDDTFSPVPNTSGFHTILTWLLNSICYLSCVHRSRRHFLRLLFRENCCPEMAAMARCICFHLQDTMKLLSVCIASSTHFAACHLRPEPGILQ